MSPVFGTGNSLPSFDPGRSPFRESGPCSASERSDALSTLIMSASGWRKVYAEDGNEESFTPSISEPDRELAAAMARAFAEYLRARRGGSPLIPPGSSSRRIPGRPDR